MTFPRAYAGDQGIQGDTGATGAQGDDGVDAASHTYIRVSESTTDTQLGAGTGSGTATVINFDTENKNTDTGNFSLATEEITVADAGEYCIEHIVHWNPGTAGRRQIRVAVQIDSGSGFSNAGPFSWSDQDAAERVSNQSSFTTTLGAGDKVRLEGQRNVGTMTTTVSRNQTSFTITKIAP